MSKFASSLLALATVVWLSVSMMLPVASAQTTDISALLQQIANLQAQLNAMQGHSSSMMMSSCSFSQNLTVGSKGDDVTCLQNTLISAGHLAAGYNTGYFGNLTKAAVVKWQSSVGISPASGFFGPISRAKYASMMASMPSTTNTPGVTVTPILNGQVTVTPGTNVGGSIISGAAQIPVLNFRVANGTASDAWLTSATFVKTGVVSDSNISNAYLSVGNKIVAQYVSLSAGVVKFSGNLLNVPAGQTVDVWLRMDISSGASNGNTLSFALMDGSALTLSAGSVVGSFPITGGNFVTTSVSNPSLASVTSTYSGTANTVDAGTLGFRASALNVVVSNSPVKVPSITYTVSGSISNSSDLSNLILRIDGSQVATASGIGADGKVTFNMSSNAPLLTTGTHIVTVDGDVLGTPNRTFKFEILRPFDWAFVDSQYNQNISGGTPTNALTDVLTQSGCSGQICVRSGSATATVDPTTPTGNLAKGVTNAVIAKFAIRASGEPLRIKWLPFTFTFGTSTISANTIATEIRNISIVGDDGLQIGTTISTASSCTYGTPEYTSTTYTCSFGSSSSNVNYIVPANTTRILTLKADVPSTVTGSSVKGALTAPSSTSGFTGSNVEGQISFQTSTVPGGTLSGSALTIVASPFAGNLNSSFGNQTYVAGSNMKKISSFSVSASSAESIEVTSVTVLTSSNVNATSGNILKAQNLMVQNGSTQWNYQVGTIAASTAYTFTAPGAPVVIPAGSSVQVDVYSDVLTGSTATTYVAPFSLTGAVGVGQVTRTNQTLTYATTTTSVSSSVPVTGQNLVVASGGALTLAVDTSNPPQQQIVLGSSGVTLGQFLFTADNTEDIRVDTLRLTASTTVGAPATFSNLRFVDTAGVQVGPIGQALVASSTRFYTSDFSFGSSMIIPKNQTRTYTLKGDVSSFNNSTSSHNQLYNFEINQASSTAALATGDVVAFGVSSNQKVTSTSTSGQTTTLVSNLQTTLRTKLTASLSTLGNTTNRTRTATDDIATLTLVADSAYGADFKGVNFLFSGSALNPGSATISLSLVDTATGVVSTSTGSNITDAVATSSGVILNLTNPYTITAGTTKTFTVRINSSAFFDQANSSDALSVQIASTTGLSWASQGVTETFGLEARSVPITASVSYQ